MRYLVDANVFLRLVQRTDPLYKEAFTALLKLRQSGDTLCIIPQTIFEFWNVCTRPATARDGFGLSVAETDRLVARIERRCTLLPDTPAIYPEWRRLVVSVGVSGVQIHDARLVAAMNVHGVAHALSYDSGLHRYPGITVVHPQDALANP